MNKEHLHSEGRPYTKEEFVEKIKTDKKFAERFGNLGKIYGYQWRKWEQNSVAPWGGLAINHIDQIANLINDLKTNPDSRRLMVSAWNVGELDQMTLPPCHYGFQVYTRELSFEERKSIYETENTNGIEVENNHWLESKLKTRNIPTRAISLMFNMRSNDVPLGLPFNLASYGLLLEILAKEINMVPDELIASLGDAHIYINQIDGVKEQLTREPYPLPQLKLDDWYSTQGDVNNSTEVIMGCLMGLNHGHITLENYQSHPTIKMPLSN